jgi:hypothetical protein
MQLTHSLILTLFTTSFPNRYRWTSVCTFLCPSDRYLVGAFDNEATSVNCCANHFDYFFSGRTTHRIAKENPRQLHGEVSTDPVLTKTVQVKLNSRPLANPGRSPELDRQSRTLRAINLSRNVLNVSPRSSSKTSSRSLKTPHF